MTTRINVMHILRNVEDRMTVVPISPIVNHGIFVNGVISLSSFESE